MRKLVLVLAGAVGLCLAAAVTVHVGEPAAVRARRDAAGTMRFSPAPMRLRPLTLIGDAQAARNGSGTFSLYSPGNPVTTATTITSSWANNTLSDIATEITDSLNRSGKGGMLAALKLTNGTVGAPALTFTGDTTSGLYRVAADSLRMSVSAADVQTWSTTSTTLAQVLYANGHIDRSSAAALTIGGTNATTLTLGRTGQTQALAGNVSIAGDVTMSDTTPTISASTSDTALTIKGNRTPSGVPDTTADVTIGSTSTRLSTDYVVDFKNNTKRMAWFDAAHRLIFNDTTPATSIVIDPTAGSSQITGLTTVQTTNIIGTTAIAMSATLQANLGTPSDGTVKYCSDCTFANPCAGGGTGAIAKRLNGAWRCD